MRRADRRVALGLYRSGPHRDLLEHVLNLGVTALDTAVSYQRFTAHSELARAAGELLRFFSVSTKVGYFPDRQRDRHSLRPGTLREAIRRSVDELGARPAVVLLHNPEHTLTPLPPRQAYEALAAACEVLAEAVAEGQCDSWGIASWRPAPLLSALRAVSELPRPDVLMMRAGLSLDAATLHDAEQTADLLGVAPAGR